MNRTRITDVIVRKAKQLLAAGWSHGMIADSIGCSRNSISQIAMGKRDNLLAKVSEEQFHGEHKFPRLLSPGLDPSRKRRCKGCGGMIATDTACHLCWVRGIKQANKRAKGGGA